MQSKAEANVIIILEGLNGGGKSTVAKRLSKRFALPLFRPFRRGNSDIHYGEGKEYEQRLRGWNVPINTHIEDLYAADLLTIVDGSVILDRSLPSAIVYGTAEGCPLLPENTSEMFQFWVDLYRGSDVLYVWLYAEYEVAKSRCEGRYWPTTMTHHCYSRMHQHFDQLYDEIPFEKLLYATDRRTVDEIVEDIAWQISRM
jgi:thymidylate kinase